MSLLSKKDKKYFLIIILFSLIHNLIVFPAQAAEEYSDIDISKATQITVIKNPSTDINHFEEIGSNKQDSNLAVVNDFKIIKDSQQPKQATKQGFKIASLDDQALPANKGSRTVSLTAYTSEAAQTDDDPCTTANGYNLCSHGTEDSVAANFLPFGTKIMIPDLFGDRIFVVRDRMHKRFSNRVDVWMTNKTEALKFGVRQSRIVVLKD
jgi:3D (Asp-Asp-Asp) domain-containing protein